MRGALSTSAQKFVRPVKVVSPCVFSPRASQVVTKPATVRTPIETAAAIRREELPNPGVDGEQAQASDQDARHQGYQRGPRMREEKETKATTTPVRVIRPLSMRPSQSTIINPTATAAY